MKTNEETLSGLLNTSQLWEQLSHMLADYLLNPYIGLLYGKDAIYPSLVDHPKYKEVREKAKRNETEAVNLQKSINYEWEQVFPKQLVEFFRLRLLNAASCKERTAYLYLFLDLVGDGKTGRNFEQITADFLEMLREYLSRNCPCLTNEERSLPIAELMQTVRRYYTGESHPDGSDAKWIKWNSHIPFETLPYTIEFINLLDDVADKGKEHPVCHYFLITLEYLSGLFIYVYMVEFLIFIGNRSLPQGEPWKPNLITNLKNQNLLSF